MFDNYPQPSDYIPCNRRLVVPKDDVIIMPGETTTHSFEIPFNIDEVTTDRKIIYKLGLNIVLEKDKESSTVVYDPEKHLSILTWILSPEETVLFKNTLLQGQVQIKFTMSDGTIAYTEINPVKIEDSLEV